MMYMASAGAKARRLHAMRREVRPGQFLAPFITQHRARHIATLAFIICVKTHCAPSAFIDNTEI